MTLTRKQRILAGDKTLGLTDRQLAYFRRVWTGEPEAGPGQSLMRLVDESRLGSLGCACSNVAARMDKLGVGGCFTQWDAVCKSLIEVAAKFAELPAPPAWLTMGPQPEPGRGKAAVRALAKFYLAIADQLLEESIARVDDRPARWGKPLIIPMPPPLNLTPRSNRAIVTVATGETGSAMLAVSRPGMEDYAARLGADLVVSEWPGVSEWPMSAKYGVCRALDHYQRIAYVDADVLLRPGCVDLFAACEAGEVGLVNELAYHRRNPKHRIERDYRAMRQRMGFVRRPVQWYFNAGVGVFPQSARWLLEPPAEPLPTYHCAEQDLFNARVQAGAAEGRIKLRLLDRKCNWQHWTDHGFKTAPPDAVLHCSGMAWEGEKRLDKMKGWAA